MVINFIATERAHFIINAIVVLFITISTFYNWKLIKQFRLKITKAYLEDTLSKIILPPK